MKEKRYLSLSVHQLVDPLLREGDIDDRVYNSETMNEGSRLHSLYQSKQGDSYYPEMYLSSRIEVEEGVITLSGRADGVFAKDGIPFIDEIKTTVARLEDFHEVQEQWHLGQACCYAYMYLLMQGGEKAGVRLTYFHQKNTEDTLIKEYMFSFGELEEKVQGLCRDYFASSTLDYEHYARRDEQVKKLAFPYPSFREGQRELARYVYGVAKKGGTLFVEAPTGTGKTMSTLFPAVKSLEEKRLDKIFFLTAKNTGAQSAFAAASDIIEQGVELFDITLLAKEKVCFCPEASCNPDECPFARGYYGKLRHAIKDILLSHERFSSDYLKEYCLEHELCPFEFQLDLSLHCDLIIADYNYFFDPIVHLERYFDEAVDSSTYFALIDEAHNVLDRGRDMYSSLLRRKMVEDARKSLKGDMFRSIRGSLKKVSAAFDELLEEGEDYALLDHKPEALLKAINNHKAIVQKAEKKYSLRFPEAYRDYSREANRLSRILDEHYDSSYRLYASRSGEDVLFRALCVDPSKKLFSSVSKIKGAVFFSGTLSPIDYYMDATIGKQDEPYLLLSSPFPKENLDLMIAPKVSTRYKVRKDYIPEVAKYLKSFVQGKMGNYFLFFPSYEYLEQIEPYLDFGIEAEVLRQNRSMTHKEREQFLLCFSPNPDHTKVGLLILGGAFSEGIDLVDDRLIGVAIIGVGLPQIGKENDLIRDYHDRLDGKGFAYAYKNPGMNKVLQALGRLIRSESDRGAVLLLDERYMQQEYRSLLGRLYHDYDVVLSPKEVAENLASFYKDKRH